MDKTLFIGWTIFIARARTHAFERSIKRIVFSAFFLMWPFSLSADSMTPAEKDAQLQSRIDAHRKIFNQHLKNKDIAKIDLLLHDADPIVRSQAVATMGAIGGKKAAETLADALLNDTDTGVRMAAAFWLGSMKNPSALSALSQALQNDTDANVRTQAAQALKKLGTSGSKNAVRKSKNDKDKRVKRLANEP